MTNFGKTIKIFLIDGDPNGLISCELSSWSWKAYKIPRINIKKCSDRQELRKPWVYLLFWKEENGHDLVYIWEAESILNRISHHLTWKYFWTEAIIFINKDDNLNKAHVKYLENRLHEIAKKVNRYNIENTNKSNSPSIAESDKAEMEEFIENIKIITNTLGHKVFEEKIETNISSIESHKNTFYLMGARGAQAAWKLTTEGFVVLRGSKISLSHAPSMQDNFINRRDELIKTGIVKNINWNLEFTQDNIFSSPSAAATIVLGRPSNGLIERKLKDGTKLKETEERDTKIL